jgi:hypothetical protein
MGALQAFVGVLEGVEMKQWIIPLKPGQFILNITGR